MGLFGRRVYEPPRIPPAQPDPHAAERRAGVEEAVKKVAAEARIEGEAAAHSLTARDLTARAHMHLHMARHSGWHNPSREIATAQVYATLAACAAERPAP